MALKIQISRRLFAKLLKEIDMSQNNKDLLYDAFVEEIPISELQNKYFLSRSAIYYRLKNATNDLNKKFVGEYNLLSEDLRKSLESCRKIL